MAYCPVFLYGGQIEAVYKNLKKMVSILKSGPIDAQNA